MLSEGLFNMPKTQYAYGCVFCLSGKESLIANYLEQRNDQIRATAVRQTKRRTHRGVTTLHDEVIMPGYVLFQAPRNFPVFDALSKGEYITVLTYSDGNWRLYGDDEQYAKWIFHNNGLINFSKAYRLGDRIIITEGPLKELEGYITCMDKRNRNGQVTLTFGGRILKIWMGFDIIEKRNREEMALVQAQT